MLAGMGFEREGNHESDANKHLISCKCWLADSTGEPYNVLIMATFRDRLETACGLHKTLLCVGLDPDPSLMPVQDVFAFNRSIIDATADLVCAYKPNLAFYEALGLKGLEALKRTLDYIPKNVLTIGDGKRGDVGSTARAYARAMFEFWEFDAITVNPYLGEDSIEPFLTYPERGLFILCRTSNPGSLDFQTISGRDGLPLYQRVALKAQEWNRKDNIGLVVGATYPDDLQTIRHDNPSMPILIPGIGVQGGDLERAVSDGTDSRGRLAIISASRQIIYASKGRDFASEARRAAEKINLEIKRILDIEGKGW